MSKQQKAVLSLYRCFLKAARDKEAMFSRDARLSIEKRVRAEFRANQVRFISLASVTCLVLAALPVVEVFFVTTRGTTNVCNLLRFGGAACPSSLRHLHSVCSILGHQAQGGYKNRSADAQGWQAAHHCKNTRLPGLHDGMTNRASRPSHPLATAMWRGAPDSRMPSQRQPGLGGAEERRGESTHKSTAIGLLRCVMALSWLALAIIAASPS
jgi:hypothetical protein